MRAGVAEINCGRMRHQTDTRYLYGEEARYLVGSRSCDVKEMELMNERLPKRLDDAAMESGFVLQLQRPNTGVHIRRFEQV